MRSLWPPKNTLDVHREDLIDDARLKLIAEREDKNKGWSEPTLHLDGRDLIEANLTGADIRHVDFTGANLQRAHLEHAWATKARFDKAQLQNASLNHALIENATLKGAKLSDAKFDKAFATGARFDCADDGTCTELSNASLNQAQLQGASLNHAKLQGASLNQAELQGATLGLALFHLGADLRGACLAGAQLQGASLEAAQLQGASLDGAQLQGARLFEAPLQDGAPLDAQLWLDTQLQGAVAIEASVWRADARAALTPSAYLVLSNFERSFGCIQIHCGYTAQSFDELRQFMIKTVPAGERRDAALKRIAEKLGAEPFSDEVPIADDWKDKEKDSAPLADVLGAWEEIGCKGNRFGYNGAPYVARALLRRLDDELFKKEARAKAKLAGAFLKESCEGAKGLTDKEIAQLQAIAKQGEAAKSASDGSTGAASGGSQPQQAKP